MLRRIALVLGLLAAALSAAGTRPASAAASAYLEDFEFLRTTVRERGAAVEVRKIDWEAECAKRRPAFAACTSDAEHVKNVMRLLAVLSDSHTGVTSSRVPWKELPSKWDGLFGGGLWIGWDRGLLVLQGIMKGHPLAGVAPLGSAVVAIDGVPSWLAMERERRRITEFAGASSEHSLFASMDNRLLPFGAKQEVELVLLTPDRDVKKVPVARWGPGGKAFYPSEATLPDGVAWAEGAVARVIETPWSKKVGYVRITGSMDAATVTAFHGAFDALKGMEACLLDCRSMGGGGDGEAWEMAGRFFPGGVANGRHGRIEASGSWQFDGPVVMLQDEKEVSSAETFTWAMSETGRAVSVGRPTGGWGIIPATFQCPSGIVSFRLGVNARPTPIRGVRTEGAGWPPDVLVPYGPVLRARPDPVREIGLDVLHALASGVRTEKARDAFAALFAGRVAEFPKAFAPPPKGFDAKGLAHLVEEDLRARLAREAALLGLDDLPPDVLGASARVAELEPQATAAGMKTALAPVQQALKKLAAEGAAQTAFLAATDRDLRADEAAREKFLAAAKGTAIARFAKERLWR